MCIFSSIDRSMMRMRLPAAPVNYPSPGPGRHSLSALHRRGKGHWSGQSPAVRNSVIIKAGLRETYFQSIIMQAAHFFLFSTCAQHFWLFPATSSSIECMRRHFSTKSYQITYLAPPEIGKLLHPQEFLIKKNVDWWGRVVLRTDDKLVDQRYQHKHAFAFCYTLGAF